MKKITILQQFDIFTTDFSLQEMMKEPIIHAVVLVAVFSLFNLAYGQVSLTSSNLPIVVINTNGREIPNEPKIPATMRIVDNGPGNRNDVNGPFNDYDGPIGIEIRGSSSTMFEKKSYGIEIWDEFNNDTIASILGMPEEEDWVLHGPYSDKSLMRNFLAFRMGRAQGRYASRTRLVELMLNDDYRGVYVFMEKIKRDRYRVDIADLGPEENSGDDLTGGYIVKIDKFDGSNTGGGWTSPYRPPGYQNNDQVIFFQFDYPKSRNITPQQAEYIREYVTAFEDALKNKPSNDQINGYKSYIDLNSFVDYALINEVTRNVDAYRLSTFLHKDKDSKDGRLYIGPIWDYNLGFGNANYYNAYDTEGWAWSMNSIPDASYDYWLVPFWWQRFLTDPEYVDLMKSRWEELRKGFFNTDSVFAFIDSTAAVLEESQQRNFQKFNILNTYVWPNNFVGGTYQAEVNYLKNWIAARLEWMDLAIDQTVTDLPEQFGIPQDITVAPNPFHRQVAIELISSERVLEAEIYSMFGQQIKRISPQYADDRVRFTWDGSTAEGSYVTPGVYIVLVKDKDGIIARHKILKN